jgi:hypothetical protein
VVGVRYRTERDVRLLSSRNNSFIWNVLDMTPGGRWGESDFPEMDYR